MKEKSSGLGAYQEFQAEKSAASLQRLLKIKARVRRNNAEREIPSEEVVPGDIWGLIQGKPDGIEKETRKTDKGLKSSCPGFLGKVVHIDHGHI